MDNTKITMADVKKTFEEVLEKYRSGEIEGDFACSAKEAFIITNMLRRKGAIAVAQYEDGKGNFTTVPTNDMLKDFELTGYVTFWVPLHEATFLKKDSHRATAWRIRMFNDGYKWVENPHNPKKVVNYDHATRYYVDVIKKLFWVVDLGG